MLPATEKEIEDITEYMCSQAPDLKVQLVQEVYSENVHSVRHDVWDVHIRHIRGVPEQCPVCGSQRLSPQRGYHEEFPDIE